MLLKKQLMWLVGLLLCSLTGLSQERQVTILSVNDMHASMEHFPKFAAIVDSLRAIYPSLLLLSGGDNCTGNPYNDRYPEPSYPMTALMNWVGFNASVTGNHEFDLKLSGLRQQLGRSTFRYLCANLSMPDSIHLPIIPYQFFDCEGVRVGVLGIVQRGSQGIPDTHPDNVKGLTFLPEEETIQRYQGLRDSCDVAILLSHCGFEADQQWADRFPAFDVIIGGHSHDKVEGDTFQGGVLLTQAENKLKYATLIKIHLRNGQVVKKESELIEVRSFPHEQAVAKELVSYFLHNETLEEVLTQTEVDFTTYKELGYLMADAYRYETGADIALVNAGGVRYDHLPKGPITLGDVLRLDPFNNESLLYHLTTTEVEQLLLECSQADANGAPYTSGITYTLLTEKQDSSKVKRIHIYEEKGHKINRKTNHCVMVSSYVAAICPLLRKKEPQPLYAQTADLIIRYLRKHPSMDYRGVTRIIKESR